MFWGVSLFAFFLETDFGFGAVFSISWVGGLKVPVLVPGGAAFVGAVRVPGVCVVLGVVPSEIRTNENPSIHTSGRTGVVLSVSTVLVFGEVGVLCGCPCASIMARSTSYIANVSETQYHIYEEGNDAGGGGEASQVGVRREGKSNMSIVFLVPFTELLLARF